MHNRTDCTNSENQVLKVQFHRNIRSYRATITRGKKMKQVQPTRLMLGHVNHGNRRKDSNSVGIQQFYDPMSIHKFNSNMGGQGFVRISREGGLGINHISSDVELGTNQISTKASKGIYLGVEEDTATLAEPINNEDENLADIWKEMEYAMESCREITENDTSDGDEREDDDDCDHSCILKDDIGYVCRVCGLVQKEIQDIYEFIYPKRTRFKPNYQKETQNNKDDNNPADALPDWYKLLSMDLDVTEVLAHSDHIKQMKPHQMEGFTFLLKNVVTENPHGCILAHAPGSGKTFMIICFLQSYLAKYPSARPLVILPKGIVGTWKKEFQRWKLNDFPLYDFYSMRATNRPQQLNVLKQWAEQKSILFIGYQQFSSIVTCDTTSKEKAACREILVRAPTVLILDEGHTPRNKNSDMLHSLTQVQTPRKVVLSGTLYQNHVREVFNILNLVQPRFLKLERNCAIVRRILSKVEISGVRKQLTAGAGDAAFYDLVENTLINDENEQRKVGIIQDLREMTSHVLHYYKGDSFDELPGLIDFTVVLNLSPKQRAEVDEMKKSKESRFKCSFLGMAIYVHPVLKGLSVGSDESKHQSDEKMDQIVKKLNVTEGVKARFFLSVLRLCEIANEKLLVFSQYLLTLKFLERLAVHVKGWTVGKEIFMITGDSTTEHREWSMEQFNSSPNSRVFFGSIKACGEGISLTGASRILMLDVHLNPSVTWQAICRAFRPGQQKKVFTYRLVAADSPEEEDHTTCYKKELISKMWFEWDDFSKKKDLELKSIDLEDCDDNFLQSPLICKDIKALYKR
ncbi:unnamed protein product [Amaranthus hypochondriacus]